MRDWSPDPFCFSVTERGVIQLHFENKDTETLLLQEFSEAITGNELSWGFI